MSELRPSSTVETVEYPSGDLDAVADRDGHEPIAAAVDVDGVDAEPADAPAAEAQTVDAAPARDEPADAKTDLDLAEEPEPAATPELDAALIPEAAAEPASELVSEPELEAEPEPRAAPAREAVAPPHTEVAPPPAPPVDSAIHGTAPADGDSPIFAAMLAAWRGPAAASISRRISLGTARVISETAPQQPAVPRVHEPKVSLVTGSSGPVVRVRGDFDAGTATDLAACVYRLLPADARRIIVDLSAVTSFSPAGAQTLAGLRSASRAQGTELVLHAPSRPVREMLHRTGVVRPRPDGSVRG